MRGLVLVFRYCVNFLLGLVVDPEEGEEGSMDSAPMDEEPIPDEMCNGK